MYTPHTTLENLQVKRSVECKVIKYQKGGSLQVRVQFLLSRKKQKSKDEEIKGAFARKPITGSLRELRGKKRSR